MDKANVTAIVLAGGKSRRFGEDKSLLRIQGRGIVERIVEGCRAIAGEVFIVSNAQGKFSGVENTTELSDLHPGNGPMGGIHTGLLHAAGNTCFVVACDMPFFDTRLARRLLAASEGYDAAVPSDGERIHPLFGVYKKTALAQVEAMLQEGDIAVWRLCRRLHTRYLLREEWHQGEEDEKSLYNINYPEDLSRLWLAGGSFDDKAAGQKEHLAENG